MSAKECATNRSGRLALIRRTKPMPMLARASCFALRASCRVEPTKDAGAQWELLCLRSASDALALSTAPAAGLVIQREIRCVCLLSARALFRPQQLPPLPQRERERARASVRACVCVCTALSLFVWSDCVTMSIVGVGLLGRCSTATC